MKHQPEVYQLAVVYLLLAIISVICWPLERAAEFLEEWKHDLERARDIREKVAGEKIPPPGP